MATGGGVKFFYSFENSNQIFDLKSNKNNFSFINGLSMPWTYYQIDLLADTVAESFGRQKVIFTSKSVACTHDKLQEEAGCLATELIKFEAGNAPVKIGNGRDPITIQQYEAEGWVLHKDANGKKKLPDFGSFTFKPGQAPSYEDLSGIELHFRFGFGLNNRCYNFANEKVNVNIYNLSCKPKIYCSPNPHAKLHSKNNKLYQKSMINGVENDIEMVEITDQTKSCKVEEGDPLTNANSNQYLYILVEDGESININLGGNTEPYNSEVVIVTTKNGADNYWAVDTGYNINSAKDKIYKAGSVLTGDVLGQEFQLKATKDSTTNETFTKIGQPLK